MLHAGKISSYVKPVLNNQGLAFKQYVNYITALFVFDLLVKLHVYWIPFAPPRKSSWIELLFTRKKGSGVAISLTN